MKLRFGWGVGVALALSILLPTRGSGQESPPSKQAINAEMRQWADATGKFSVKARLLKLAEGAVHLEKADGSTTVVPLIKLSDKDRKFVSSYFKALEKREAAARGPWQITSHEVTNIARNSDGTFSLGIGTKYLKVTVTYAGVPGKEAARKFRLRLGNEGTFIGSLNNSSVKGRAISLLFEGVSGKAEELYLCDEKGNQRPLVDRGPSLEDVTAKLVGVLIADMMKTVDNNGDGRVTEEEFRASRRDEFLAHDSDEDGFLDVSEMKKYGAAIRKKIADMQKKMTGMEFPRSDKEEDDATLMKPLDKDQDGKISASEFSAGTPKEFLKLDLNGDGWFDAAELKKGMDPRTGDKE